MSAQEQTISLPITVQVRIANVRSKQTKATAEGMQSILRDCGYEIPVFSKKYTRTAITSTTDEITKAIFGQIDDEQASPITSALYCCSQRLREGKKKAGTDKVADTLNMTAVHWWHFWTTNQKKTFGSGVSVILSTGRFLKSLRQQFVINYEFPLKASAGLLKSATAIRHRYTNLCTGDTVTTSTSVGIDKFTHYELQTDYRAARDSASGCWKPIAQWLQADKSRFDVEWQPSHIKINIQDSQSAVARAACLLFYAHQNSASEASERDCAFIWHCSLNNNKSDLLKTVKEVISKSPSSCFIPGPISASAECMPIHFKHGSSEKITQVADLKEAYDYVINQLKCGKLGLKFAYSNFDGSQEYRPVLSALSGSFTHSKHGKSILCYLFRGQIFTPSRSWLEHEQYLCNQALEDFKLPEPAQLAPFPKSEREDVYNLRQVEDGIEKKSCFWRLYDKVMLTLESGKGKIELCDIACVQPRPGKLPSVFLYCVKQCDSNASLRDLCGQVLIAAHSLARMLQTEGGSAQQKIGRILNSVFTKETPIAKDLWKTHRKKVESQIQSLIDEMPDKHTHEFVDPKSKKKTSREISAKIVMQKFLQQEEICTTEQVWKDLEILLQSQLNKAALCTQAQALRGMVEAAKQYANKPRDFLAAQSARISKDQFGNCLTGSADLPPLREVNWVVAIAGHRFSNFNDLMLLNLAAARVRAEGAQIGFTFNLYLQDVTEKSEASTKFTTIPQQAMLDYQSAYFRVTQIQPQRGRACVSKLLKKQLQELKEELELPETEKQQTVVKLRAEIQAYFSSIK